MSTHTAAIRQLLDATQSARSDLAILRKAEGERFNARQQAISAHDRVNAEVAAQVRFIERLEASITALESLDEPVDGDEPAGRNWIRNVVGDGS